MTPDPWPLCRFHAPRWVYPGDEIDVGVDLLCDVEVDVDRIELFVVAKNGLGMVRADGWMDGELVAQDEKRTFSAVLPLADKTKLLKGSTVFATKFVVPEDTPPSHAFGGAFAYFGMEARVIYDKDKTYLYWFWTRVRPPKRELTREPIVRASEAAGLEVSLASSEIASGEAIEGAIVARQSGGKAIVQLELVGELVVPKAQVQRFVAAKDVVSLPPDSRGLPVPFRFRVPEVMASFSASSHALAWQLRALRPAWMRNAPALLIPLTVVDTLVAQEVPLSKAIPALGDPRIGRAFEEHAEKRGWTLIDQLFVEDQLGALRPVVKRKHGDAELALAFAYRREGMYLIARVTYPRLGLELSAIRERRLLAGDIRVGVPPWDQAHHLTARAEAQCLPFARAVVDGLVKLDLGELARWSDDEIVFARRIKPVRGKLELRDTDLEAAQRSLEELAGVVAAARGLIAAPEVVDLDAWLTYVRELRGTLTAGDLSVDGMLGTYPVAIRLRWERAVPTHVEVRIGDPATATDDARAVFVESPHPVAERSGLATRVSWEEDIVDFYIAEGVVGATWELTVGTVDTIRVRQLVDNLHLIRRGLDLEIGPYR